MEEDTSLDDFFAKKDKSKKKTKVKSGDSEDVSKATKKDKKKDKLNSVNSSSNKTQEKRAVDDEWNDFEEEKAVDYSGLRIQNLQKKGDQENDTEGDEEELDENGELKDKRDGMSGPWNKSTPSAGGGPAAPAEEKPAAAPVVSGKYVPPNRAAAASSTSSVPGSRRKKELPNIRSELDFPTLAPGQEEKQNVNDNTSQRKGANLALENKFSVLQD